MLEVGVKVGRHPTEHDPAAFRHDSHDLQSFGVSTDFVNREVGGKLGSAIVKGDSTGKNLADRIGYVVQLERNSQNDGTCSGRCSISFSVGLSVHERSAATLFPHVADSVEYIEQCMINFALVILSRILSRRQYPFGRSRIAQR